VFGVITATSEDAQEIKRLFKSGGYIACDKYAKSKGLLINMYQSDECKHCGVNTFVIELHDYAGQVDIEVYGGNQ